MVAAVTLLPALLGIAGKRVNSLRVPFVKQQPANNPQSKSARWTAKVVAKPVRYGAVAAILLGVLAIPAFSMRLGFPDAGNDTAGSTTRKSYDLIADNYGPGVNGPLAVVVETHGSPKAAAVIGRPDRGHRRRQGRRLGRRADLLAEEGPGDHQPHADHGAAGREDLGPARAAAHRRHPRRRRRHRRRGVASPAPRRWSRTSPRGCSSGCRTSWQPSSAWRSWC